EEMTLRSKLFYEKINRRRTVREFSDREVPVEVIENCIRAASTAPSGAHKQPWAFCVVSNPEIKIQIREAAEKEEYENYHGRMNDEWLEDLAYLGTDWKKPFLEKAPWLIILFKKIYDDINGNKKQNYYVQESVGIACGFFLMAVFEAGLTALTHTPSPMKFLSDILQRPENERPFLLIPVGYPASNVSVPDLIRKPLNEVMIVYK
ncbi:MAG: nitroreductase family protein, partial [Bacteroidia bacterium]|nr:nitroreductase family protein [Bacteroidia bacterium]